MNIPLRLGHLGLLESAPLLVAQEHRLFAEAGLHVELACELGSATLWAKLADQRLMGACLPVEQAVVWQVGSSPLPLEVVKIIAFQNYGLVLPSVLPPSGELKIGVPAQTGAARHLAHLWRQTLKPANSFDLSFVSLTMGQLPAFMSEGLMEGLCGFDPLSTLVGLTSSSCTILTSSALAPRHPGAVLALRPELLMLDPEVRPRLQQALNRAAAYCSDPRNASEIWSLVLHQPPFAALGDDLRARLGDLPLHHPGAGPSIQFQLPATPAENPARSCEFIEAACRTALRTTARGTDLKSMIERTFGMLLAPARM
jgi:two-component system, oxyanion-binding sensor